jgi:hypothetical protein
MKAATALGIAACAAAALFSTPAGSETKLLPRSVYLPFEFALCEHLQKAILYQDDLPVSAMPAHRVFQFTYYPDLDRLLPEVVQVRVEGSYADDGSPFLAKLAITPDGIHTAHSHKGIDLGKSVARQRHKIDIRLDPRKLVLKCARFCSSRSASGSELSQ